MNKNSKEGETKDDFNFSYPFRVYIKFSENNEIEIT